MKLSARHTEILALVTQLTEATVDELAERLGVSRETIRRDLTKLDVAGKIKKLHGGARFVDPSPGQDGEGSFAQRIGQNTDGKRKAALAAVALIKTDDSLFLDAGTTTLALAKALVNAWPATIITNSLRNAEALSLNPKHRIFVIGGEYRADVGENLGPLAIDQISRFHARMAMLTVAAIDVHGAMNFDLQEAEVAKAMISRADEVVVIADDSKFGKRAVFDVATMSKISTIITNSTPPQPIVEAIRAHGVRLITADHDTGVNFAADGSEA